MVLLYYDPLFLQHQTGRHPECATRIVPAVQRLIQCTAEPGYSRPTWQPLSTDSLGLVHSAEHITSLQEICQRGGGRIEADTVVSSQSFEVALLAAGAVADAVEQVVTTDKKRAFCLVRPPGHHALANHAMGFCLFNNIAVGAKLAIAKHHLQRVLIVDWDVHHGNGTQDLFWNDPQVGFFSIHRYPFYPGTGAADETGGGLAIGTKLNVPITFGTSRQQYLEQFEQALEKIAAKMKPELVLISAGFDAHHLDPIGSLGLEAADFQAMTRKVIDVANRYADGRIVSVLEGGYHPDAVAECVDLHIRELSQAN